MLYSEGVFGQIIFLFSWVRKKEGPFEKYDAIRKTCNSMDDSVSKSVNGNITGIYTYF